MSFSHLVQQCQQHIISVQEGYEHEGGWLDVYGGPFLAVPRGVWKFHTKREKERALTKMLQCVLEKIPGEEVTAQKMASCFMRFTWDPSHYTVENMEKAMQSFLDNLDDLKKNELSLLKYLTQTYGKSVLRYTVGGRAVPRIPVVFDKLTFAEYAGGGKARFEQGKLYDLYKIVHPSNPSLLLVSKPEGFTIQRHIMLYWWQARTEYTTYMRDCEDLCMMIENREVFDCLSDSSEENFDRISPVVLGHTFFPAFVDNVNEQLMRDRILSFGTDTWESVLSPPASPPSSPAAPPTVARPKKKRSREEEQQPSSQRCFRPRTLYK